MWVLHNSQRFFELLLDKELLLADSTIEGVSYSVYNVFYRDGLKINEFLSNPMLKSFWKEF